MINQPKKKPHPLTIKNTLKHLFSGSEEMNQTSIVSKIFFSIKCIYYDYSKVLKLAKLFRTKGLQSKRK